MSTNGESERIDPSSANYFTACVTKKRALFPEVRSLLELAPALRTTFLHHLLDLFQHASFQRNTALPRHWLSACWTVAPTGDKHNRHFIFTSTMHRHGFTGNQLATIWTLERHQLTLRLNLVRNDPICHTLRKFPEPTRLGTLSAVVLYNEREPHVRKRSFFPICMSHVHGSIYAQDTASNSSQNTPFSENRMAAR